MYVRVIVTHITVWYLLNERPMIYIFRQAAVFRKVIKILYLEPFSKNVGYSCAAPTEEKAKVISISRKIGNNTRKKTKTIEKIIDENNPVRGYRFR
jgi:hypothetical protein